MTELGGNDLLLIALSFVAGLGLGLIYFGGLWYTVQSMAQSPRPGLLFLSSFAVRLAVVLGAIYWIGLGDWRRMAAALLAMILVRIVLTRRLGPPGRPKVSQARKGNGAQS